MPILLFPNGTVELTNEKLATGVVLLDQDGNILTIGGAGGTSSTDDGAFTAGASSGTPMMGFVTVDEVDAGDVGVVGMLANRQLKVTLFDSSGVEVAGGGGSGGTQYTEDAAAAANPVGNAMILVRADSPAGRTTTDGDNVAATGTDKGELYVKHADSVAVTGTFFQATQPVSGPVTDAELRATAVPISHAALTELAAAIDTEVQVDIVSSALPTGAATAANQTTVIGHLDGVETLLGTIDADTGAIKTAVEGTLAVAGTVDLGATDNAVLDAIAASLAVLDNAIAGNEMQVDVLTIAAGDNNIGNVDIASALPAGTNAIGNVGLIGRTTGGLSSYTAISTAAVLTAEIKASAGQVFDIECFNVSTAPVYVRIYNQTGAPATTDAANIIWRGMIPANADADAAGFVRISAIGRACSAGIGIRASGAVADDDATALAANVAFFNVGYS